MKSDVLLRVALPEFAEELADLLRLGGHPELVQQVSDLRIAGRCSCGDESCATFYTQPKPKGSYGKGHRNVVLDPEKGMIILDVVNGTIACVEVLDRHDVRRKLIAALQRQG